MTDIAEAEGYPGKGHRSVTVLRLAEVIGGDISISPAFDRLISTEQSRKGGSILAGLAAAVRTDPARANGAGRHVVCYTDADLSANLAQLGSLAAPVVAGDEVVGALGQRYGIDGAVLVRADGPVTEPHSTSDKPDKIIILFRHFVRALLIPPLAQVLDTQAGFKVFDAAALGPAIGQMTSFNETFDVELLIHLAQHYGPQALAVEPIVFTEDFAATNFPSVEPGPRHLTMVHQVVELYDRLVAPIAPVTGEAADLLTLIRTLDLDDYVTLIEHLRAEDPATRHCSTGDGPCSTFATSSAADTRYAHPQRTHWARSRLRERASSRLWGCGLGRVLRWRRLTGTAVPGGSGGRAPPARSGR